MVDYLRDMIKLLFHCCVHPCSNYTIHNIEKYLQNFEMGISMSRFATSKTDLIENIHLILLMCRHGVIRSGYSILGKIACAIIPTKETKIENETIKLICKLALSTFFVFLMGIQKLRKIQR